MRSWSPLRLSSYAFPAIQRCTERLNITIPHGAMESSEQGGSMWGSFVGGV